MNTTEDAPFDSRETRGFCGHCMELLMAAPVRHCAKTGGSNGACEDSPSQGTKASKASCPKTCHEHFRHSCHGNRGGTVKGRMPRSRPEADKMRRTAGVGAHFKRRRLPFLSIISFFSFCRGQKACCGVAFLFPTRRLVICKGDAPIPLPSVPKSDKSLTAVPDGGKGRGENRGWCAGLIARGLLRQVASLSAVRGEEGCDAMGG